MTPPAPSRRPIRPPHPRPQHSYRATSSKAGRAVTVRADNEALAAHRAATQLGTWDIEIDLE